MNSTSTIPPGGSATWSLTKTSSFTSSVTGEASATFKAGAILAEASTTIGFSLKAEGSTTPAPPSP